MRTGLAVRIRISIKPITTTRTGPELDQSCPILQPRRVMGLTTPSLILNSYPIKVNRRLTPTNNHPNPIRPSPNRSRFSSQRCVLIEILHHFRQRIAIRVFVVFCLDFLDHGLSVTFLQRDPHEQRLMPWFGTGVDRKNDAAQNEIKRLRRVFLGSCRTACPRPEAQEH